MSTARPGWLYDLALCFHLLGAFSLVSGSLLAGVAFEVARRQRSSAEIALILRFARLGALLVMVGTVFAVGFGLWLVDLGDWGYGTPWVDTAIGLIALVAVIGTLGGQRPKTARKLAASLAERNQPPTSELQALLDDRVALALNYLSGLLLLVIVAVMVFKPGSPHS